jgi:hypothetical protein
LNHDDAEAARNDGVVQVVETLGKIERPAAHHMRFIFAETLGQAIGQDRQPVGRYAARQERGIRGDAAAFVPGADPAYGRFLA